MWRVNQTTETSAGQVAWGSVGSGQEIVLAHGWPWSSFSWHRVIEELSKKYRVYWYDMVGFGGSEMDDDKASSLDVQGEVFTEMLEYWNLDKPIIWAHDFGGAVTLRAHLLHGADYKHLVLMNVVALSPWGSEFFDHVGRHVDAFMGLPPHIHSAVVKAYIQGALVNELGGDDLELLIAPWLSDAGRISFYKQFAQADDCYTDEFADKFQDIRCAVSIIWGKDDPWIPLARGKKLADIITDATFQELDDIGHLPQLEAPQTTLTAFLSEMAH